MAPSIPTLQMRKPRPQELNVTSAESLNQDMEEDRSVSAPSHRVTLPQNPSLL